MVSLCGASVVKKPSLFTLSKVSVWCPPDICPMTEQGWLVTHQSLQTLPVDLRSLSLSRVFSDHVPVARRRRLEDEEGLEFSKCLIYWGKALPPTLPFCHVPIPLLSEVPPKLVCFRKPSRNGEATVPEALLWYLQCYFLPGDAGYSRSCGRATGRLDRGQ